VLARVVVIRLGIDGTTTKGILWGPREPLNQGHLLEITVVQHEDDVRG
jgi:hypothetical protein